MPGDWGPLLPLLSLAAVGLALLVLVGLWLLVRTLARPAAAPPPQTPAAAAAAAAGQDGNAAGDGASPPATAAAPGPFKAAARRALGTMSDISAVTLASSFRNAVGVLKANVTGRDYRYRTPWFAFLGEAGSGKSSALAAANLSMPFGRPGGDGPQGGSGLAGRRGLTWWFFDRGVVLDVSGDLVLRPDGTPADEVGWRLFLRLLQRFRPQRPIDGVILALPATDLFGPGRPAAADLADKADILHRRLWQMQKTLGLCVPVYILVTKCDHLPGFARFWQAVPEARRHDMFGWSSPYGVDGAYGPRWVDEAFLSIGSALLDLQVDIAARPAPEDALPPDGGNAMVLFPGHFIQMRDPLGVVLDQLFQSSAYHQAFFLRGLYFCGDIGPTDDGLSVGPETEGRRPVPILVTDLLAAKVFREHALARPAAGALASSNRTVRTIQAALAASVVVLGGGLGLAVSELRQDFDSMHPVLAEIGHHLGPPSNRREGTARGGVGGQEPAALRMLDAMGRIRADSLESLFLPTSWVSTIDDRIAAFLAHGFDRLVMRALLQELIHKTEHALDPATFGGTPSGQAAVVAEEMPEFKHLAAFVEELETIQTHARLYNNLSTSRAPDDMAKLSRYLFGFTVPDSFSQHPEFYRRAIKAVRRDDFDTAAFADGAAARLRAMTWKLYERLFYSGPVVAQIEDLTTRLREAERPGRSVEEDAVAFQRLLDSLDRTRALLDRLQLGEMGPDRMARSPAMARLVLGIERSDFLGAPARDEFIHTGMGEYDRFQRKIAAYKASVTGPVLVRLGAESRLDLAPPLIGLHDGLVGLLGQEFMQVRMRRDIRSMAAPDERLLWSVPRLDRAIGLYQAYDRYLAEHLQAFPPDLQPRVRALMSERLNANLYTAIADAQEVRPLARSAWLVAGEDEIRADIRNFRKAAEPLGHLLTITADLGLIDTYDALYRVTAGTAYRLLERIDEMLESEGLYKADVAIEDWDGTRRATLLAFNAADDPEVQAYLDLQRQRVDHLLTELAAPVVGFLSRPDFERSGDGLPLVRKWQRIHQELTRYNARRPGSSVVALERFIRFDIGEMTAANCTGRMALGAEVDRTGDFFLARRGTLASLLWERCRTLAAGSVTSRWARIANLYNRTLSGRYPFADIRPEGRLAEADIESVRTFFRTFDAEASDLRKEVQAMRLTGASRDQVVTFLDQLDRVRRFLAPVVDGDLGRRRDIYDVEVDFRVNRPFEAGANQIIEWTLDIGGRQIRQDSAERKAVWRHGEPVRLSLRWARNSPFRPLSGRDGQPRVDPGGVAVFEYPNAWGLFALLDRHAVTPGDFSREAPPAPHLLRFEVDVGTAAPSMPDVIAPGTPGGWVDPGTGPLGTAPADRSGWVEPAGRTRAYVWIGVAGSGKPDAGAMPLAMPTFPVLAPELVVDEAGRK